jgi:hypothetical protein
LPWKKGSPAYNQYSVWSTDAGNGNLHRQSGHRGPRASTLLSFATEAFFQQDINGDGVISSAHVPIETHGATTLATGNNHFYLQTTRAQGHPSNSRQRCRRGQFGGGHRLRRRRQAQATSRLEVTGSISTSVWSTDANGNYSRQSGADGRGQRPCPLSTEASFQQTQWRWLISPRRPIETHATTTLALWQQSFLSAGQHGRGAELKLGGPMLSPGQFGGWTPIAAETTGSGYEVAWKVTEPISIRSGARMRTQLHRQSRAIRAEGTTPPLPPSKRPFQQDLNGDGLF